MVPYMASKSLTPLWSIVVALYVYAVCAYSGYMEFRVHFLFNERFYCNNNASSAYRWTITFMKTSLGVARLVSN